MTMWEAPYFEIAAVVQVLVVVVMHRVIFEAPSCPSPTLILVFPIGMTFLVPSTQKVLMKPGGETLGQARDKDGFFLSSCCIQRRRSETVTPLAEKEVTNFTGPFTTVGDTDQTKVRAFTKQKKDAVMTASRSNSHERQR